MSPQPEDAVPDDVLSSGREPRRTTPIDPPRYDPYTYPAYPPQPAYPPYPYAPCPYGPPPRAGRGKAVSSLVLGIVGVLAALPFFFPIALPCGVLAVVFGALGRRHGLGKAGLSLGITALGIQLIWLIGFVLAAGWTV